MLTTFIKNQLLFVALLLLPAFVWAQVPVISSFAPTSGTIGSTVTITGSNFNTVKESNIVWFGGVKAAIQSASATQLVVRVPTGAGINPIMVLNTSVALSAISRTSFITKLDPSKNTIVQGDFAAAIEFPGDHAFSEMLIADVDGDGKPDVVTASFLDHEVLVYRNTTPTGGTLSLANPVALATISNAGGLAVVDLDGDGKPEIVTNSIYQSAATVFRNISDPGTITTASFVRYNYSTNFQLRALSIADMNNDGKPDLITNSEDGNIGVSENRTTKGNFDNVSFLGVYKYKTNLTQGATYSNDFDNDGKVDVLTSGRLYRNTTGNLANGLTFDQPVLIDLATSSLLTADIDADGKTDIVSYNQAENRVSVFRNTSVAGTVSFAKTDFTFTNPTNVSVADLNADGKPEILVDALMLVNNTTPGVINNTSFSQVANIFNQISNQVIEKVIAGDLDGDGKNEIIYRGNYVPATGTYNLAISRYRPLLPPSITSFTPTNALSGATVTITGVNFTGTTAVSFGGVAAASFIVNNDTSISAVVGAGASGIIAVTTPAGTASLAGFTSVAAPTITSTAPIYGAAQNITTINGTNFTGATAVSFGGVPAQSFTVDAANKISAIPAATGASGNIAITTAGGTATLPGFVYVNVPNVIYSGTLDLVDGDNVRMYVPLADGYNKQWYKNDVAIPNATDTTYTATTAGVYTMKYLVNNIAAVSNALTVTVSPPAPVITSATPLSAGTGTTVTIIGARFTGATVVSFGGVAAASFTVNSPTSISAVVPANAVSGRILVTTPAGSNTLTGFVFIAKPTITSLSPNYGSTSNLVVINGTGFTGTTAVSFGGVAASSFFVDADNKISAGVGSGASGDVAVTTDGGTVTFAGFTYYAQPRISSFTPTHAQPGQTVTINGTGFTGVNKVEFGTVPVKSFIIVSDTQITAVLGDGDSGKLFVGNPATSVTTDFFTFDYPPSITSFTPFAGAGAQIVITGKNLSGVTAVSIGGIAAASFIVNSATTITAVMSATTTTNNQVSVTSAFGTASADGLVYPKITASGPLTFAKGGNVVLSASAGTGFTYAWYKNGLLIAGENTSTYTATETGTYSAAIKYQTYSSTTNSIAVLTYFALPVSNFKVAGTNVSCKGQNNGSISMQAVQSLNYKVTLTGPKMQNYTFDKQLNIDNLSAGIYNLCITLNEYPEYQQCFTLNITEPKDLALYSVTDLSGKNVTLQLNGGNTYNILLNGKQYTTTATAITLPLSAGNNKILVSTDKPCQGVVEQTINTSAGLKPYPSPFNNVLYVNLGAELIKDVAIKIYNVTSGKLVLTQQLVNKSGVVQLDASSFGSGVYSMHLFINDTDNVFKISKQ